MSDFKLIGYLDKLMSVEEHGLYEEYEKTLQVLHRGVHKRVCQVFEEYMNGRVRNPSNYDNKDNRQMMEAMRANLEVDESFELEGWEKEEDEATTPKEHRLLYYRLRLRHDPVQTPGPEAEWIDLKLRYYFEQRNIEQLESMWTTGAFKKDDSIELLVYLNRRMLMMLFSSTDANRMIPSISTETFVESVKAEYLEEQKKDKRIQKAIDAKIQQAKNNAQVFSRVHEFALLNKQHDQNDIRQYLFRRMRYIIEEWESRLKVQSIISRHEGNRIVINDSSTFKTFIDYWIYGFDCIVCALVPMDTYYISTFQYNGVYDGVISPYFKQQKIWWNDSFVPPLMSTVAEKKELPLFAHALPLVNLLQRQNMYSDNPQLHFVYVMGKQDMMKDFSVLDAARKDAIAKRDVNAFLATLKEDDMKNIGKREPFSMDIDTVNALKTYLTEHPDVKRVLMMNEVADQCSAILAEFPSVMFYTFN